MSERIQELSPGQLRATCDLNDFKFETTEDLEPLAEIIGQERATRAIDFGVSIMSHGYNIFASGPSGTGRTSIIKEMLERIAATKPPPDDWCYVYNFTNPHQPNALRIPTGQANELRTDIAAFLSRLQVEIGRVFDGPEYQKRQSDLTNSLDNKRRQAILRLESKATEVSSTLGATPALHGLQPPIVLHLTPTPTGLAITATQSDKPLTTQQLSQLSKDAQETLQLHSSHLNRVLDEALLELRQGEREVRAKLTDLAKTVARALAIQLADDLFQRWEAVEEVPNYLHQVCNDVSNNVDKFPTIASNEAPPLPTSGPFPEEFFSRYHVNVLVDNSKTQGAPIVIEPNPTYHNLIGRIEPGPMMQAGALHRASGGYLMVEANALLANPLAWDSMKRALENREVQIEDVPESHRVVSATTLRPEQIPLNVKVVLLGSPMIYDWLQTADEDFANLFKVKADFDSRVERTPGNLQLCAQFIGNICRNEDLLPLDKTAVAGIVEFSSRLVEDQTKLSARFAEIGDLVRESAYWAGQNGNDNVTAEDVRQAIHEKICRSNMIDERLKSLMQDGTIMVDTHGESVGQVNGLSVSYIGDHMFGKPSRITAATFMGDSGVVHIEREVEMAGRIHNKGVLILNGYIGNKFAQEKPLALSASLTFEQMYDEVEGDSASSTELYALLSALSGLPIRQSLAVTGSVNQNGEIQPIGGATCKIEGFFDLCKMRGLTDEQGVLIPVQNVKTLMLREDIVDAVREGKFHVYPVRTIDEGIELLTGLPAGERGKDGRFPEATVNFLVDARLRELAEMKETFEKEDEG